MVEQAGFISLEEASAAAPAPDAVVWNGIANQYADHPIEVPVGEEVRVFVLNAGPSIDSSFHVVGTIFHDVIKEGVQLTEGNEGNWGSQAVDLSPAQGAIVEMRFDEDGLYPIVTHAFNFVGRGALGLFQAGDGGPAPAGGHSGRALTLEGQRLEDQIVVELWSDGSMGHLALTAGDLLTLDRVALPRYRFAMRHVSLAAP